MNVFFGLICNQDKMAQYNTVNVKNSNLQLDKLKSTEKNSAKVNLRLSSNMTGNTNLSHKMLLTDREVSS